MMNLASCGAWSVLAVSFLVVVSKLSPAAEVPSPGSTELPVTTERLTDALLKHHRSDPQLVWSFRKENFVLEIGGRTVPRRLIETLTGDRTAVARIEGTWELDERKNLLNLTARKADDQAIHHASQLSVSPAGLVRIDLGDYQYNLFPNAAKHRESQPKLAFRQAGEDLVVSATIEIVDAPYVLWTHANLVMDHTPYPKGPRGDSRLDRVELSYAVIQCRDNPYLQPRRHRKQRVEVTWRFHEHRKADVPYRVIEQFKPSADELLKLAPQLERIAEETRERSSLSVP